MRSNLSKHSSWQRPRGGKYSRPAAMQPFRPSWLVVLLAGCQLAISAAGEGLHFLPGMGHFEQTPGGYCLWNGAPRHDWTPCAPVLPGDPQLSSEHGLPGEIAGPSDCPICRVISLSFSRGPALGWLSGAILCGQVSIPPPQIVLSCRATLYGARAPPVLG